MNTNQHQHLNESIRRVNAPIEESVDYSPLEDYLSSYFDGNLSEDVSGDDIVTALEELIDIAELADHYLVEIGERMTARAGAAVANTEQPGTSERGTGVSQKKYDQGKRVAKKISQREPGQVGGSPTQRAYNRGKLNTKLSRQGISPERHAAGLKRKK